MKIKLYKNHVYIMLMIIKMVSSQCYAISFQNFDLAKKTFLISDSGKYDFNNNVTYNYNPTSQSTGNPLVKITASDVVVDFQGVGVTNQDTSHIGWIGVEIGWTPQELLDDSSREQPKNIIVKNISLYNFDCGLIIHGGVEGVKIDNCHFYKTLLGVGLFGTENLQCRDITFKSVTIFGISGNYQNALQNFKTKIETDFAYGSDYFMPIKEDPFNGGSVDVYTYYGIYIKCAHNTIFDHGKVSNIGYEKYATVSEGNGSRSEAVGIGVYDVKRFTMNSVLVSDTASEIKAVGLQLDDVQEVSIKNSDFSYAQSAIKAVGIEVVNNKSLTYSVSALFLDQVATKSNIADEVAIGMDLSAVRGVEASDILSKFNQAGKQAYGVYAHTMHTVDINKAKLSENIATRITNDIATQHGVVSAGFWAENVHSFQHSHVDFTSMESLNSAYGLYLKDSSSCQFLDCQFVGNVASQMRSGEGDAIRSEQDSSEISMYAPSVDATMTGGYGALLSNCQYVKFERCVANSNKGHRAFGISARNSRSVAIWDTFASTQTATGGMFDNSLVSDISDPTAFPILAVHKPLLFGDFTKNSVDAVKTTDLFLQKLQSVRNAQAAAITPAYSDILSLLAATSLLQATIARYRIWSVAMGVHVHNVKGFLLRNCRCLGQVSVFDNAFGMCFSGRNAGHAVNKCNLSFNVGGYYSSQVPVAGQSYQHVYNIVGLKPFWEMLFQQKAPWTVWNSADLSVDVTSVSYSPDGTKLAVGTAGNEIKIYNTSDWTLLQTLTGHTAAISSLSWRQDGTELASASSSSSNNIKIWNTSTWVADQTLTHGSSGVASVHFKVDGTQLASASLSTSDNIKIWNTSTWVADQTLTHGSIGVHAVKFSSDGLLLSSGSGDATNNIKIWNTSTWVADQTLYSHASGVTSFDWKSDDSLLISGSLDDTIKIWETSGWTVSQTISPGLGNVNSVSLKPDDTLLAVGFANNSVNVYNTSDWSLAVSLSDFTDSVEEVAWSTNGRLLATGSNDNSYRVYGTNIYKQAATAGDVGLYTEGGNYRLQDSLVFTSTITDATPFVDLTGTKYPFVSPVGPISSGLVVGDLMVEALIRDNNMYGNAVHVGQASGVLLNKGFSVTVEDNLIAGNNANIHGWASGIVDVTAHSPNLYMRNFLEGNKCSTYNNSNYFVPFNSSDANNLSLPVKKIFNGNFSNITNKEGLENIIVEYSQESEFSPYDSLATVPVHPDIIADLTNNNCWS